MMTGRHLFSALGFAFVAIWITLNFGWAVLCLVGALAFYLAAWLFERALGGGGIETLAARLGAAAAAGRFERTEVERTRVR